MTKPIAALAAAAAAVLIAGCGGSSGGTPSPNAPGGVNALIATGIQQQQSGDNAAAKTTFQQVLNADPTNKYALYNLGVIAGVAKDDKTALSYYDKAIAVDPTFTSPLYNKALLVEGSDPTTALQLYRTILTINPKASTTHLHLGLLLLKSNQPEAGRQQLLEAVKEEPDLAPLVPQAILDDPNPSSAATPSATASA